MNNSNQPDSMFKSEGHRVIFFLTNVDSIPAHDQLGVKRIMYVSRSGTQADVWRANIADKVNSAECSQDLKEMALSNLNKLYKRIRGLA